MRALHHERNNILEYSYNWKEGIKKHFMLKSFICRTHNVAVVTAKKQKARQPSFFYYLH